MAKAFVRAYRRTRAYLNEAPAAEIARAEKRFFPQIDEAVLADCIATYQQLGCWTPHVEITQPAFEATLDVFAYNGLIKRSEEHTSELQSLMRISYAVFCLKKTIIYHNASY